MRWILVATLLTACSPAVAVDDVTRCLPTSGRICWAML